MATMIKKKKRELKSKAIGLRGDVKLVACDLLRGVVYMKPVFNYFWTV